MLRELVKDKYIEPVVVESRYATGLPEWYAANGLRFHWFSWVLCELSGRPGNPVHYVIFTGFRGPGTDMSATRWNPSYEDDEHREDVRLGSLHYWKPVAVVVLDP